VMQLLWSNGGRLVALGVFGGVLLTASRRSGGGGGTR
jgi:hypothetical protein